MSGEVVGWAFRQRELSPTQKLVLVAIADNAQDDGKAWPGKKLLIEKTGLGKSTIYRSIEQLTEAGLMELGRDERGVECYWLSVPQREKPSQSGKANSRSGKALIEEPSVEPSRKQGAKKKYGEVNRKTITESEFSLAAAVVAVFNKIAGTRLRVEPHLTPIVSRIRERPELTAEHHRLIVEAVFAGDHWWKGPPGPRIIYGNAAQFEQSIELARARAKQTSEKIDPDAEYRRMRKEQGLD